MPLEQRYNLKTCEKKWQEFWEKEKVFSYEKNSLKEIFSIDTPPPTVSGKLHIGHVFSYTQTEIIARYQRMLGKNVMYPFGFDDNGLPTEILTEKEHKIKAPLLSREEFNSFCSRTSKNYRELFTTLWKSLGFSCDWNSAYSTISLEAQKISQRSFLDLYKKGYLVYKEMPTIWSTKSQTTIAQAEIEDVHKEGIYNFINFSTENGENIPIATTRPELLSSCVAMFIHPENTKFKHLIGKKAIVPIFKQKVKILADEKADPEKGTGIVMCCTFGDVNDIAWWREHNLEMKISITKDGKMNELAGEFCGLEIEEARKKITEKLLIQNYLFKQEDIPAENRIVNVHERTGVPVEFINIKQWFIKVVEYKDELIAQGEKINWHPSYMKARYIDWVKNLSWDWSISRQRFFGVPIPIAYCLECGEIIPAKESQLPINPLKDKIVESCPKCNSNKIKGESDVLDTWATSSSTPQINAHWKENDEDTQLQPMTMRPQAHDIIRTWAFYTIVKSYFHFNDIPWHNIVISGHVVKKHKEENKSENKPNLQKNFKKKSKISKSKDGETYSPTTMIEKFGADAIRYWASSGTLGTDISFDSKEISNTSKILNKLWNSSRFVEPFIKDFDENKKNLKLETIDKWILHSFSCMLKNYHKEFEKYEFFLARTHLEQFFWKCFCDNYLEFIKKRLYKPDEYGSESFYAAQWTVNFLLLEQIKLFAPFIPHITEEIYQNLFKKNCSKKSIHLLILTKEEQNLYCEQSFKAGELLIELIKLIRTGKTQQNYSIKLAIDTLAIQCSKKQEELFRLLEKDLKGVSSSKTVEYLQNINDKCKDNEFIIEDKQLKLKIKMDALAVQRNNIINSIKPEIVKIKQSFGLKSKSPIKEFFISGDEKLVNILKSDKEQVKFLVKAEKVYFSAVEEKNFIPIFNGELKILMTI